MSGSSRAAPIGPVAGWLALAAMLLYAMHVNVVHLLGGWDLALGSTWLPTHEVIVWWALWMFFGVGAALATARAVDLALRVPAWAEALRSAWRRPSEPVWIACMALLAFTLAGAAGTFVLQWMPVTVDESAYRFSARLLASGHLWIEPYPDKIFFDRKFLVNDARMYSQYFLGWPALLAPFDALGIPQWANPTLFAASVPAVHAATRRMVGQDGARLASLLFATAPLAVFGAATQLSHTACTFWLAWTAWFAVRGRGEGAPWWAAAGLAIAFGGAFFTRPPSALGVGGPFVVWWAWGALRERASWPRWVAFAVPAVLLAAVFLAVNHALNGSPWLTGYDEQIRWTRESPYLVDSPVDSPHVFEASRPFVVLFIALFRFNYSAFGWPLSVLFAAFAFGRVGVRPVVGAALGMAAVNAFIVDVGIDTFGPVHFFEWILPLVILTAAGVSRLVEVSPSVARATVGVVVGLLVIAPFGYHRWRVVDLRLISDHVRKVPDLVEPLGPSVVFVNQFDWAPWCEGVDVKHFVKPRPDNRPDLSDRVLWVNHATIHHDRGFVAHHFPDRVGYYLDWDVVACVPRLRPLDSQRSRDIPPGMRRFVVETLHHLLEPPPEREPGWSPRHPLDVIDRVDPKQTPPGP